ncbi:helix-turn-helix domain-containing protein [Metapseudomonas resinovorans]|uniref:helix-turn-helix domain-containing protein n=1 Tax=Metapseudomonas resinovorans TaxID=53412 RepID=UPI003D262155
MMPGPLNRDDYAILISLLRSVRKERGITQVQLAQGLGVEQSMVSKIERRERRLDASELRRVCLVLGISLLDFVKRYEIALEHENK